MPWIPVHQTRQIILLRQWKPQYHSIDDSHSTTPKLADEPTLANGPIRYHNWNDLHTNTQNLADEPTLVHGSQIPLGTRDEMPWIPLHKTWQKNVHGPKDPHSTRTEMTCYHYTKFGRWTYFGQWTPSPVPEQRCLEYKYTKLGRQTYFGWWIPHLPRYQSIDPLNISTPKLGRQSYFGQWTLPNTRAEMTCIPLHKTWQINLLLVNGHQTTHPSSTRVTLEMNTNLADEPSSANGPLVPEQRSLA